MKPTSVSSIQEQIRLQSACPYCRALPVTNNPGLCTCMFDCHREDCGRRASGEPEYQGNDFPRSVTEYLTAEDRDPEVQAQRAELRRRIADEQS